MSYVKRLQEKGLLATPPPQVYKQLHYEVIMGSFAYGVSSDMSDTDVYGFCVPAKNVVFPHLNSDYIHLYDKAPKAFEQWQQHHVFDSSYKPVREFDLTVFNIVKYFKLCHDGNPNMIDSLFVPRRCITHITPMGELVRENRKLFLSKKCWHTFKGYAYSQLQKMNHKQPEGKRVELVKKYGYDVKFAYHLVRLINEIQLILSTGDLDLEQNREQLKDIRKGNWSQEKVVHYFEWKEKALEQLYNDTKEIPYKPRTEEIRELLFKCLEMHFTSIGDARPEDDKVLSKSIYGDIINVLSKYEGRI